MRSGTVSQLWGRRVDRAQDALTHAEESVYDCLWGSKGVVNKEFRVVQMGYQQIALLAMKGAGFCQAPR